MAKKIDCNDVYKNYDNPVCSKKRLKRNCDKFNGEVEGNVCKIGKFKMARSDNIFDFKPKKQSYRKMSPTEFLRLAPDTQFSPKRVNELKTKIKKGEMDVLFFDVDVDSCQVLDHEGRHRAKASQELGIKEVPVVLFNREFDPEADGGFGTKGRYFDTKRKSKCKSLRPQKTNR